MPVPVANMSLMMSFEALVLEDVAHENAGSGAATFTLSMYHLLLFFFMVCQLRVAVRRRDLIRGTSLKMWFAALAASAAPYVSSCATSA